MKEYYGKIILHDNGMPVYSGTVATPGMILNLTIPYKKLIQKEYTEKIGREILNNSIFLMKHYKPFTAPCSEESGQCDNIGHNYSIDTKLLLMQSVCFKISKDNKTIKYNKQAFEYVFNCFEGYRKYKKNIKAKTMIEKNQYEIISKIYATLKKYPNKNILFLLPIPQMDLFYMNNFNFSESFFWQLFWVISQIKKDCKFRNDVYFTYPTYLNQYNLVKINVKSFICESFVESTTQKKIFKSINVGMFKDTVFHPFFAEIIKGCSISKFKYKRYK